MGSENNILSNLQALGFTNISDAAIYKIQAQGIGSFIDNILTEFANTKNSILNTINTLRYGKSNYYETVAKGFQFGDDLIPAIGDLDPSYAIIDPSKQIINQAAFQNINDSLSLKVATSNLLTGGLQQLTIPQLAAFQSYFTNFEILGLPVTIVSLPGNVFGFNAIHKYNSGYDLTTLQANTLAALNAFDNTFLFNGTLYTNQVSDYIKQNVPGTIDFFLTGTTIDGVPYSGSTTLQAGYFNYIQNIANNIIPSAVNG